MLTPTATTTSSKSLAARPTMSRWPLVTGSNDPGQTARRTGVLPCCRVGGGSGPVSGSAGPRWRDRTKAWSRRSASCGSSSMPGGQVTTVRLRRPFDDHQGTRHEPAVVHQRDQVGVDVLRRTSGRAGRRRPRRRARRAARRGTPPRRSRPPGRARSRGWRRCGRSALRCAGPARPSSRRRPPATTPRAPRRRSRRTGRGSAARRASRCGDSIAENNASRTRSLVGRVVWPRGVSSRRPPAVPPMMRVMSPWSALLHELRRRGALDLGDDVGQGGRLCERRILGE